MKFCPLGDYVLVQRIPTRDTTEGGIVLPGKAKQENNRGYVLAVGPGTMLPDGRRVPVPFSVGARVLFDYDAGVDVQEDGTAMLLMPLRDVWAVLE